MTQTDFPKGLQLHRNGQLEQAQAIYQQVLAHEPNHPQALISLGVLHAQKGNPKEALDCFERALTADPDNAMVHMNRANALQALAQHTEAIASYDHSIALKPDYVAAHVGLAQALKENGQTYLALQAIERAIGLRPEIAHSHWVRGLLFRELNWHEKAIESFDRALATEPDQPTFVSDRELATSHWMEHQRILRQGVSGFNEKNSVEALHREGAALLEKRRFHDAIHFFDTAIAKRRDSAESYFGRGNGLVALGKCRQAVDSYDQAIRYNPQYADAFVNCGNALSEMREHAAALNCFEAAYRLEPNCSLLKGLCVKEAMHLCKWDQIEEDIRELCERFGAGEHAALPLTMLSACASLPLLRKVAQVHSQAMGLIPATTEQPRASAITSTRIHVGYFSADFHNHATMHLMAEMFELHDRSQFELTALSFGPNTNDDMRARIASSFDRFIDVNEHSDAEVAQLARKLGIDIAVDLKGFTHGARPGIFAHRAAPVQVSYLGYPGTMGVSFMDYLIADPHVIPPQHQPYYEEKIAYLPHCYQVNDRNRHVSQRTPSRKELGLPDRGFVFCCFNQSYKILPETFTCWMRILLEIPESVIWLLEDNPGGKENLQRAAVSSGVQKERLVFAPRMRLPDHLARHKAADLFLDTWPYNAHTTASDALWSGLPVLTLLGEAFAGRVAASLLYAVGLPELIATCAASYEAHAIELAKNPELLSSIQHKLAKNRLAHPLFDSPLLTRNLENLYREMQRRSLAGVAPDHICLGKDEP